MPGANPGALPSGYGRPTRPDLGADIWRLLGPGDAADARPRVGADGGRLREDSDECWELARSVALDPLTSMLAAPVDVEEIEAAIAITADNL